MAKKKVLLYLFDKFNDPVIQSNIFLYIEALACNENSGYEFSIITYEHDGILLKSKDFLNQKKDLAQKSIYLYPLNYIQGKSVLLKLWCMLQAAHIIFNLRVFKGYKHLVSLGTISGSFAYLYSKIFGLSHYLYQYEPHSEFTLELGYWSKNSLGYRLLNTLEKKSALAATVISSGTRYMQNRLTTLGVKAKFYWIPSVVNEHAFNFSEKDRNAIRNSLCITPQHNVFIYVGKFGGIYYKEESVALFKFLVEQSPDNFILVLTPQDHKEINDLFESFQIPHQKYAILQATYSEIPAYLSASDFGLVTVPPTPAQKFRSPIKVGEYLCCGIPYLTVKGVSEDDIFALEHQVGVVVDAFTLDEFKRIYPQINHFLSENKQVLRVKCRKAGITYRGFQTLMPRFESAIQTLTTSKR